MFQNVQLFIGFLPLFSIFLPHLQILNTQKVADFLRLQATFLVFLQIILP